MTKVVVFTGAGISAESGLKTFRGEGGLWEGVPVSEVATPEAWHRDFKRVLRFYNERRKAVAAAQPNAGHTALVRLAERFQTTIITQNIDDLHERAGSRDVLHLHGEIGKSRSTLDERLLYDIPSLEINPGDTCERGSQLRPHIVWFGEAVPMMEAAIQIAASADIFLIVGTSLEVYPAASLIDFVPSGSRVIFVDPAPRVAQSRDIEVIAEVASRGVPHVVERLLEDGPH